MNIGKAAANMRWRKSFKRRSLISRVFHDFFNSCITVEDASQAVFAQGDHSQFNSFLPNDDRWSALVDESANGIVNGEQLENAFASFIAGVVAISATATIIEDFVSQVMWREVKHRELAFRRLERRPAILANRADQPLAKHRDESRRN